MTLVMLMTSEAEFAITYKFIILDKLANLILLKSKTSNPPSEAARKPYLSSLYK